MLYTLGSDQVVTDGDDYWIAPNAAVIGKVRLEKNASVWWSATIRGDTDLIIIGENSNVQDGSVLHTDPGLVLRIGKNVTIGHLVMLHGCEIGDNTLVGIGSVILNRSKIGKNCLVGANTFIPENKEIPDGSMVLGSPGRVVRKLTEEEIANLGRGAVSYMNRWKNYKKNLKPVD
jgi:carbonic anhydrase/acetyltransferase-like protein (isoleucine patch superfamily)